MSNLDIRKDEGESIEALTDIPVSIDLELLLKKVHVEPDTDDAATVGMLVERALEVAKPKALYAEAFVEERGVDTVRIEGVTFRSRMLRANLDAVERVFPFVTTCGEEMDEARPPGGDFLQDYWWDTIKEDVLGCAIRHLSEYLKRRFLLGKTSQMSPGAADAEVWPIEQQGELFAIFGDVKKMIGVELTPSFLMSPNKSTSGIKYPTETEFRSCQVCRREDCQNRAAPFDGELWRSIQSRNDP